MDLNILFLSSFIGLGLAGLPFWWKAFRRKKAGIEIFESRETIGCPFGFTDVVLMFFFWLMGQFASVGLACVVLGIELGNIGETSGSELAWLTIFVSSGQLVVTAAAMLLLYSRYRSWEIFGLTWPTIGRDLTLGGLAFLMVVPAILVVQSVLTQFMDYHHETLEMLARNADGLTITASWFAAVLIAPICEEIFFRGVLQAWLHRVFGSKPMLADRNLVGGWDTIDSLEIKIDSQQVSVLPSSNVGGPISDNPYLKPNDGSAEKSKGRFPITERDASTALWPILGSAALFGLAHFGQGPAPFTLFLFGIALGYLYYKTGSVFPCIVLHMLLNGFSMFWFTLNTLLPTEVGQPQAVPVDPASVITQPEIAGYIEPFVALINYVS